MFYDKRLGAEIDGGALGDVSLKRDCHVMCVRGCDERAILADAESADLDDWNKSDLCGLSNEGVMTCVGSVSDLLMKKYLAPADLSLWG